MRILKFLSAIAILNLAAVGIISNYSKITPAVAVSQFTQTSKPSPTPIIIVKKVVTKVFRTMAPQSAQIAAVNANVTNNTVNNNNNNPLPTNAPTQSAPSPTPAPPPQNTQCIITIDGGSYNVTNFRLMHSGGNIFSCGTDMSQTFWSRHNAAILSQMQQYRI